MSDDSSPPSLGKAALWATAAKWFDVAGSAIAFLILARMLGPETFGLYGVILLAALIPETLVGGALGEALIQKRDLEEAHASGVFWLQTAIAALMAALLTFFAPQIGALFERDLVQLLPVFACALLPLAMSAAPAALLQRQFRFGSMAAVDAASSLCAGAVGVVLALNGVGVWALVWMEIARRCVRLVGFMLAARWLPSFAVKLRHVLELWRFSAATLATRIVSQTDNAIPRLFLGLVDVTALGYFSLAQRIFQQSSALILAPFNALALPMSAHLQQQADKLRKMLEDATRLAALICYPLFVGGAAIAPVAVPLLFGAAWTQAVPAVQIMLLLGVRAATASFNGAVLRGVGLPGQHLLIVAAGALVLLLVAPLAAQWGITAMAAAVLLRSLLTWAIGAALVQRAIGYPARKQVLVGWQSLIAASGAAVLVLWLQALFAGALNAWLLLAVLVASGAGAHLLALALLSPQTAKGLLDLVLMRLNGRARPLASAERPTGS